MAIGIIGAMEQETTGLLAQLEDIKQNTYADLTFYQGVLAGNTVVLVQSGVGKVNAAICTQILVDHFAIKAVINIGLGGGIDPCREIGDIVISNSAVYHDFDVTVFGYKPGEIPSLQQSYFPANPTLRQIAYSAATVVVGKNRCQLGLIASGDQFISSTKQKQYLYETFGADCVDMEGTAIAHTAFANQIPYVIIRIVSDKADSTAPQDFTEFSNQAINQLNRIVIKTISNYSITST